MHPDPLQEILGAAHEFAAILKRAPQPGIVVCRAQLPVSPSDRTAALHG